MTSAVQFRSTITLILAVSDASDSSIASSSAAASTCYQSSSSPAESIPPIPPPPPPRDQSSAGAGTIDPDHVKYNGEGLASQFLYAHNKIRAKYYLSALRWNRTLAHSNDRIYGENLFWSKYGHWTPKNVVKTWADENKYYDFESNQCLQSQPCDNFTQIIWKSTTDVGCGRAQCGRGNTRRPARGKKWPASAPEEGRRERGERIFFISFNFICVLTFIYEYFIIIYADWAG
ncbi:Pathogenesis-related protein PR-1 [Linum perenne]